MVGWQSVIIWAAPGATCGPEREWCSGLMDCDGLRVGMERRSGDEAATTSAALRSWIGVYGSPQRPLALSLRRETPQTPANSASPAARSLTTFTRAVRNCGD